MNSILSGVGYYGLVYPGALQGGTAAFQTSSDGAEQQTVPLVEMNQAVTISACRTRCTQRTSVGCMHAIWIVTDDAARTGDCMLMLAARSRASLTLWRSFFRWAQFLMDAAHVFGTLPDLDDYTKATPPASVTRCHDTSGSATQVCAWWSEFDVETMKCIPDGPYGDNVLWPQRVLQAVEDGFVEYGTPPPPPSPPPDPNPPPSPPPGDFQCGYETVPSRKYSAQLGRVCWRWNGKVPGDATSTSIGHGRTVALNREIQWPERMFHQDYWKSTTRCGSGVKSTRTVAWDRGFKQPRAYKRPATENPTINTNTCGPNAALGCNDGQRGVKQQTIGDWYFGLGIQDRVINDDRDPSVQAWSSYCPFSTDMADCGKRYTAHYHDFANSRVCSDQTSQQTPGTSQYCKDGQEQACETLAGWFNSAEESSFGQMATGGPGNVRDLDRMLGDTAFYMTGGQNSQASNVQVGMFTVLGNPMSDWRHWMGIDECIAQETQPLPTRAVRSNYRDQCMPLTFPIDWEPNVDSYRVQDDYYTNAKLAGHLQYSSSDYIGLGSSCIASCPIATMADECNKGRLSILDLSQYDRFATGGCDDSCAYANNGICEDGFFGSWATLVAHANSDFYHGSTSSSDMETLGHRNDLSIGAHPNAYENYGAGRCDYGTDCSDCGQRTSVRPLYVTSVCSDTCGDNPNDNYAFTDTGAVHSSDYGSTTVAASNNGICEDSFAWRWDNMAARVGGCGVGTDCFDCGIRDIYANEQGLGGCSETCATSNDGYCTDGGEGSYRRRQDVPGMIRNEQSGMSTTSTDRGYIFDCEYGTDCTDCGPRTTGEVAEEANEFAAPTGPEWNDCANDPSWKECCRVLHTFTVIGGAASARATPQANNWQDDDITGCEAACLAFGREGEDQKCLPVVDECEESTLEPWQWDAVPQAVQTWCLCGAELYAPPPPPAGSGRRMSEAGSQDYEFANRTNYEYIQRERRRRLKEGLPPLNLDPPSAPAGKVQWLGDAEKAPYLGYRMNMDEFYAARERERQLDETHEHGHDRGRVLFEMVRNGSHPLKQLSTRMGNGDVHMRRMQMSAWPSGYTQADTLVEGTTDALSGGHFVVSDEVLADILRWKYDLLSPTATCQGYDNTNFQPPVTQWQASDASSLGDAKACVPELVGNDASRVAGSDECCVTDRNRADLTRHMMHSMDNTYGKFDKLLDQPGQFRPIGTAVSNSTFAGFALLNANYDSDTAGQFKHKRSDVLMSNRLYINPWSSDTNSGSLENVVPMLVGPKQFKYTIAHDFDTRDANSYDTDYQVGARDLSDEGIDIAAINEDDHVVIFISSGLYVSTTNVEYRNVLDVDMSACKPFRVLVLGGSHGDGHVSALPGYKHTVSTQRLNDLVVLSHECAPRVYVNPMSRGNLDEFVGTSDRPIYHWDSTNYWEMTTNHYPDINAACSIQAGYEAEYDEYTRLIPRIGAGILIAGSRGMRTELLPGWPQLVGQRRYLGPADHAADEVRAIHSVTLLFSLGTRWASVCVANDQIQIVVQGVANGVNRWYMYCRSQYHSGNNEDKFQAVWPFEDPDYMTTFGSAADETTDLLIQDLNDDDNLDVIEINAYGVSRIYYFDDVTSVSMDFAALPNDQIRPIGPAYYPDVPSQLPIWACVPSNTQCGDAGATKEECENLGCCYDEYHNTGVGASCSFSGPHSEGVRPESCTIEDVQDPNTAESNYFKIPNSCMERWGLAGAALSTVGFRIGTLRYTSPANVIYDRVPMYVWYDGVKETDAGNFAWADRTTGTMGRFHEADTNPLVLAGVHFETGGVISYEGPLYPKPPRSTKVLVSRMTTSFSSYTLYAKRDRTPYGSWKDPDIVIQTVADHPGSCAMRCHELGRAGRDSFTLPATAFATIEDEPHGLCYCGPHFDLMKAPYPPPNPPEPPGPPPSTPASPSPPPPAAPPPSPPAPYAASIIRTCSNQLFFAKSIIDHPSRARVAGSFARWASAFCTAGTATRRRRRRCLQTLRSRRCRRRHPPCRRHHQLDPPRHRRRHHRRPRLRRQHRRRSHRTRRRTSPRRLRLPSRPACPRLRLHRRRTQGSHRSWTTPTRASSGSI
ncbi:MAG: hypothetical protein ACKVI4_13460 [Actinomycetales bacterium]